ncbi:MAG: response regulator [Candidatus Latescibacteria bacterium]|nr:response regulator [Candidatus Latescibacterota bacterium]
MSTPSLAGAKILLVDDTPANLKVLRQTLEADGYNISVATSGEGALKLVVRAVPDLVLLDVMMPGMDGYDTCRRLQQVAGAREIPVIFITARGETEGIVEGFRAGGMDYIAKPFQVEEVLVRIKTHLERAFLARTLAEKNTALQEEINRRKTLSEQLSLISSLAMCAVPSPAPMPTARGVLSWRIRAPCSWTRSGICRWSCKPSCCGCWRTGWSRRWAGLKAGERRCGYWPPPTPTCRRGSPTTRFARISTFAWRVMWSLCHPCASAGRISPCWPAILSACLPGRWAWGCPA